MSREIVEAKVTFVVNGGEVVALFRAIRSHDGTWRKENPYIDACGRAVIDCYAHVGQHGTCVPEFLRSRRATPGEYASLLAEMENIGYKVTPHQFGRLNLKD